MMDASDFFVLRAPLLPLEELDALRADPDYWQVLAARPEVREALHLASPGLARRLAAGDPDARVAASVTAYLVRMCTRATPFGLFAGCARGTVGDVTALVVDGAEGTTRHSRPDTEVLASLVERLMADPAARPAMVVEPNTSRYRAAGALRLIESRLRNNRRTHHLVVVEDDSALQRALETATGGAEVDKVVAAVAAHADVDSDEARDYVDALIEAQVLTPVAEPAVTGPEPLAHVMSSLASHPATVQALHQVRDELSRLDGVVGNAPSEYDAVATALHELAGGGDDGRLVQVDLHRAGTGLTLGPDTIALLGNAIDVLHRVMPAGGFGPLSRFKAEFRDRYDDGEVPLMEALDEEMGIGFDRSAHPAADESPLLADVDLGGAPGDGAFTARDAVLLDLVMRAGATLELDADVVARLATPNPEPLPDALSVMASLLDGGAEIHGVHGPSGAELLGRFCHGDDVLHQSVRAHLRAEEAHAPGVVFAEIIHLPEGRVGNVLARPVLRDYELVLLGRSGAPADRQISVDELTVRLDGDRVVLYSPRLGKEVRPRLSTAHNPAWRGFGVYRFLAALQSDGVASSLMWDWGAVSSAPALPRVTAGPLVLSRARWRLSAAEVSTVTGLDPVAAWAALTKDRGLPTEVLIADGDNRLYIDTTSEMLTATAAKVLRGRAFAVLEEVLDTGVATGPAGRFAHELIVPFVRRGAPAAVPAPWRPPQIRRTYPPGSEWLYLKVYTGTASADRILTEAVAPVVSKLRDAGSVDRWFFLRYNDPDHHLRLRLRGRPAELSATVLPALTSAMARYVDDGTIGRIALDTYQREVERYGGDAAIELAEQIHCADSDAAVEALGLLGDDADARWRMCLYSTARLAADAGLDLRQRRDWAKSGAAAYRLEYPGAATLEAGIGSRWRSERADLTTLLDDAADHPHEAVRQVFRRRSAAMAPLLAELAELERRSDLTQPFPLVLHSVSHLNAVRLLRSAARTHELMLLSFLDRHDAGRIARAAKKTPEKSSEKSVGILRPQPSYL